MKAAVHDYALPLFLNPCLPNRAAGTLTPKNVTQGEIMKVATTFLLMPFLLLPVMAHAECQPVTIEVIQEMLPYPPHPQNEKASAIIGSVGNILNHVSGIVSDPSRPNIVHNTTGILAHIINIALAAKHNHKSQQELFIYICDELHLDHEMREILKLKIEEIQREAAIAS